MKNTDASNNGLQVLGKEDVTKIAFVVDACQATFGKAAGQGADFVFAHHGISWGGGIRRLVGPEYEVVKAAMAANVAIAAYHLPLDASRKVGNNFEIARALGLKKLKTAFSYHGNVIGVVGVKGRYRVGICSGGAGEFAVEAKRLGCDVFVTGEASWGEVVAAENVSMPMVCAGHYETEVYGVTALMREMKRALKVKTVFIERNKSA